MAKDWITIETIYSLKNKPETKAEQRQKSKRFKSLMAKTKTLSIADKRKESIALYNEHKAKEDSLLKAFEEKKLKSEDAIKQAIRIKKERAKLKNGAKQNKEKVSEITETTESAV